MAAAAPLRTRAIARSMLSMTAAAEFASGRPVPAPTAAPTGAPTGARSGSTGRPSPNAAAASSAQAMGITGAAQPGRSASARNRSGESMEKKAGAVRPAPPARPARQALSAISPPMPAGSPMVRASAGADAGLSRLRLPEPGIGEAGAGDTAGVRS